MGEWVEHGGGAAFSIPMTDMRQKPSGKKVPQHFLKKGSRAPATAPPPAPTPPTPTAAEGVKSKVLPPSSNRSRIQNYRKDAVPRDKFQDAVVAVPKRPSAQFDVAQYQKQTETAEAYRRAKDLDDDATHLEETEKLQDENEWDDMEPPQDDERGQMIKHRRHGGALPRRDEGSDDEEFDDRLQVEDRDIRRQPPGRINQNYSRRPLGRQLQEESYDDELEEEEVDGYGSPPPPRRGQSRGRQSNNIDGFKKFLVEKMKELEEEISTYIKENLRLQNIIREQEIVLQMEEKEDARHQLEADQNEFEQYKEEELKQLRARAKQMEQRAKEAAKVIPKKEREEIEALTGQLEQLREEMRVKDSKARAERERLRREISDLQLQNTQLQTAAREQQLREINKQFDARAAERRKPASRAAYQKQYEQQLQTHLNEDGGTDDDNDGDEECIDDDRTDPSDHRGLVVQQVANQGRAPPSSSTSAAALQTGGKQGHSSPPAGTVDKRRQMAARPTSQSAHCEDDPDSEDDPQEDLPGDELVDSHTYPDGKVQKIYSSGKREIIYKNGTVETLLPSGHVILHFSNGDIKKTFPSTKVIYYHALHQTTHITYPNGMQVFEFVNQQLEKHYPDDMKEIALPDGTIKYIYANGNEESIFPTGAVSQSSLRKMIRSSTHTTVAKAHNLQPHGCSVAYCLCEVCA